MAVALIYLQTKRQAHEGSKSAYHFIFSRTITSKIFGKQRATCSYTDLIIISSEMIFIFFSAKNFQAVFEKQDGSYMYAFK
jgi:hypothetical protein